MANISATALQSSFATTLRSTTKYKLVWLTILIVLTTLIVWQYRAVIMGASLTAKESIQSSTADAGMVVDEVAISGNVRLTPDSFESINSRLRRTPILAVNIEEVYNEIIALPWVKEASVSRVLPNKIAIEIVERKPFALWQMDGEIWLVDVEGHHITDKNLGDYANLPFLVGEAAPQAFSALVKQLMSDTYLINRISSAVFVGERRWDLVFDTGARLRLPETSARYDAEQAWIRFSRLERDHQLLSRDVAVYDMRLADRMVVSLTETGRELFDPKALKNERAT